LAQVGLRPITATALPDLLAAIARKLPETAEPLRWNLCQQRPFDIRAQRAGTLEA
jgi:hypothetical protein